MTTGNEPATPAPNATPDVAPDVVTPPVPDVVTPDPAPDAAPDTNTPAPDSAPAAKTVEPSLLGDEPAAPVDPDKPAEPAPSPDAPAEPPIDPANQSAEPAPLPVFEAWTLPEGVTANEADLTEFTKDLAELARDTNMDAARAQAFGQKLIDQHVSELQSTIQRLTEHYENTWQKQKTDWKEDFKADPELGGNRHDTTLNHARLAIQTFGGTAEQQKEFKTLMDTTGLGNNKAVIGMLARMGEQLVEGKPLPASIAPKAPQSKIAKRYGGGQ